MMTMDRPRRVYMPFWKLAEIPLCPVHGKAMIVETTRQLPGGWVQQYRKCPVCDERTQSVYGKPGS